MEFITADMPRQVCPVCNLVFENEDRLQDHTAKIPFHFALLFREKESLDT